MSFFKEGIKRWGRNAVFQRVLACMAESYIRFAIATSRWSIKGSEHPLSLWSQNKAFLICTWHDRLLMAGHPSVQRPLTVLASAHRDGQILSTLLRQFGLGIVHGSTNRGGGQALRALLRQLKQGIPVALTTDGPRGPRYQLKPGVVGLARLAHVPIVPFTWCGRDVIRLKTWDRLIIPLPFSRGTLQWGEPIMITPCASDAVSITHVQNALMRLTEDVDAFYTAT